MDAETIGSAGSLVGAGLATAGQYAQSVLLDAMENRFVNQVGFLFFLLAAVSAIFTLVITGKAGSAVWLLLAPPIVFTLLFVRIESGGTQWKFGDRVHDRSAVKASLQGLYGNGASVVTSGIAEKPIRVSVFFAKWDGVTSGITNSFIRLLNLIEPSSDQLFVNRTERFMSLFGVAIPDREVAQLLQSVLYPKCGDWISIQQSIANPTEVMDRAKLRTRLDEIGRRVVVGASDNNYNLISRLNERRAFGSSIVMAPHGYTCPELWNLAARSAKVMASSLVVDRTASDLPAGVTPTVAMQQIAKKFGENGKYEPQDQINMMNAVAAQMLYSAGRGLAVNLASDSNQNQLRSPHGFVDPYADTAQREAINMQKYTTFQQYRGKGEFLTYMLGLPYVQGMGYYFLSLAFPMFALVLIFPRKMGAILLWMQLWAWLKAWDFGFAIVMVMDDLLYFLLPHGAPMTDATLSDPGEAFKAILSSDPTYSADLYYNLVATMLAAVPILSGLLVGRGGKQFINMLVRGTDSFAGRVGVSMTAFAASMRGQQVVGEAEMEKLEAARAARGTLLNDPEVRLGAALAGFGGAFNGAMPNGMIGALAKGLGTENKRYGKQLLHSRVKAVTKYAAFQNSISESQIRRSEDLLRTGAAFMTFAEPFPIAALMELDANRHNYRLGGAIDKALGPMWKQAAPGFRALEAAAIGIGANVAVQATREAVNDAPGHSGSVTLPPGTYKPPY